MKLYRIVHKSLIDELRYRPQVGAFVVEGSAFILTFDSFPMAVLEHPFYNLVLGFPKTFYLVTYQLPDTSYKHIQETQAPLYIENIVGNRKFCHWIKDFFQSEKALVAEFQSFNWPSQRNFLINVLHPEFENVMIYDFAPVK